MFNEELLKKLEFDIRFKYSPVYFLIEDYKVLNTIYYLTTRILKIDTNSSYVEYLLEFQNDKNAISKFDCVFFIDVDNRKSDVFSTNYYRQRNSMYGEFKELENLPDYAYQI